MSVNSFGAKSSLTVDGTAYEIFRLDAVDGQAKLPYSLKVLLENLLRNEDGANITKGDIAALASWDPASEPDKEIQFTPARVIMQDFTGVPCVVDLATMREAMADLGGDPALINPLAPAELVIDHSVQIDVAGASGLIRAGSPPRSAIASRMVARSTTQGTPVKSCMITRAGVNWISVLGWAAGSHPAKARTWSAVTFAPSSVRSRFSASTFRLYGSRSSPGTADRRKTS